MATVTIILKDNKDGKISLHLKPTPKMAQRKEWCTPAQKMAIDLFERLLGGELEYEFNPEGDY